MFQIASFVVPECRNISQLRKFVLFLQRREKATKRYPVINVGQTKNIKAGLVLQTPEFYKFGRSRIIKKFDTEKMLGRNLTNDEEAAPIKQNRRYTKDENILGLSVEQRQVGGKTKEVLVFLTKKGKEVRDVPENVWLKTNCGKRVQIATVVEESGRIVPLRA